MWVAGEYGGEWEGIERDRVWGALREESGGEFGEIVGYLVSKITNKQPQGEEREGTWEFWDRYLQVVLWQGDLKKPIAIVCSN